MRTVSFSNPKIQNALNNEFVSIFSDTTGDPTAGSSFKHSPKDSAGPCGKGAGRQNVQTIFMTPDEEIFHVSTGFLSAEDLAKELVFAKSVFDKMQNSSKEKQSQTVEDAQVKRLNSLGFSKTEINQQGNPITDAFLGGPNPKDFGMNLPTGFQTNRGGRKTGNPFGQNLFDNIARQRVLKDAKYVLAEPLRKRDSFEQDPAQLVGRHKSFFGTNSSMNGVNNILNNKNQNGRFPFGN